MIAKAQNIYIVIKIECGGRWSSRDSDIICPLLQEVKVLQISIFIR